MAKFLVNLFRGMWNFISNALINLVYGLLCIAEIAVCLWIGYTWILAPMAATPGARDSPALLVVGSVILGLSLIPAIILIYGTRKMLLSIFPNWQPINFDEV